jgi:hypothetical protein
MRSTLASPQRVGEHARTEFPMLRDMLAGSREDNGNPRAT